MQLTAFTDISLRTLMYLQAHPGTVFNVKQIAEYYDVSRHHLVKVVHRLSQLGYIETTKGKGGGMKIADYAGELRLGDLIKSFEPNMNTVECFDPNTNRCILDGSCSLKHYLRSATDVFIESLNEHTLADCINRNIFSS
ncbi:MAG: Rrf2 family transcriptional regulator [Oleiphilus sp.]